MQAGINLFSLRKQIATEEDFLKTALRLKEMGYTSLQFSGAPFDAAMIARVSGASGLPVTLTHVPLDRILNDTERLAEEHRSFGCRRAGLGMMPLETVVDERACRALIDGLQRAAGAEEFYVEQDDACDDPDPFGQVARSIRYLKGI